MKTRSLQESLTHWTGLPNLGAAFQPRLTRAAATEVRKLLQDVDPQAPAPYDLQMLHERVATEWHRSRSLSRVSPRDLRQLPWVLFYPPQTDPIDWLGAQHAILRQYGRWLKNGRRTRSVLALLHEFIRVYPVDLQSFGELRTLLRRVVLHGTSPAPASLQRWLTRCGDFRLLEADGGKRFVSDVLSSATTPKEILHHAGLDAGLAYCGFLKSGIRNALPMCTRHLERNALAQSRLERLVGLLECDGKLRFGEPSMRVKSAEALLGPFIDRPPPAATKETLQTFFLRHFGDPRLPSGKHKWSGVPGDVIRVMIRWLVERALDQFFMLLKETAYDHHWRYREAFWRAFLDADLIDDIWFALGSRAEAMLWKMSDDPEVLETTAELYAAQSDQSVLLMRMPGITIAEWSHNGSCHLWLDGVHGAPKLYEQEYGAHVLKRPYPYAKVSGAHSQRHDGSQQGKWQDKIARWLRENTGIELDRDRYFPRRLRATKRYNHSPRVRSGHQSRPTRYRRR